MLAQGFPDLHASLPASDGAHRSDGFDLLHPGPHHRTIHRSLSSFPTAQARYWCIQ
jgi:hypothetical protein